MKKVAVWLSDEEQDALAKHCEKEGRSMYSVLKEAVASVIGGETPITPKQDVSPSLPAPSPPQISPKLQKFEERVAWLEKQADKTAGYEALWQEVSEVKATVREVRGLVSGLLLRLTKTEELEDKLDKKTVDAVAKVLENLGFGGIKEGV